MSHVAENKPLPLHVTVPALLDSLRPLEIQDDYGSVKAAFVERYAVEMIPSSWEDQCGFYVLFSPIRDDNSFEVYVGKSVNFKSRLQDHVKQKDWWRTALIVTRDSSTQLTTTQALYLEGRMREILAASRNVKVHNHAPTGDKTLPKLEEDFMERIALSALRIMFLRGYRNAHMGAIADGIANSANGIPQSHATGTTVGAPNPPGTPSMEIASDLTLAIFASLRAWRLKQSKEFSLPAFVVLDDKVLRAIAENLPTQESDLLALPGLGPVKVERYGKDIISIVKDHLYSDG